MDPGIPIPPTGYGGIERIVALLALEYKRLGHTVELLSSSGSSLSGIKCHSIGPDGFPSKKCVRWIAIVKAWNFLLIKRNRRRLFNNFLILYNIVFLIQALLINRILEFYLDVYRTIFFFLIVVPFLNFPEFSILTFQKLRFFFKIY